MSADSVDPLSGDSFHSPEVPDAGLISHCHVAVARGSGVTVWHGLDLEADTSPERKLRLSPDRPAIIGRIDAE
jgi:hypothetical protein